MRQLLALVLLGTLAVACGDDGGAVTATDEPGSTAGDAGAPDVPIDPLTGEVELEAVPYEALQDLPAPAGSFSPRARVAMAGWGDGAVFLAPAGGVLRLPGEGSFELEPTEGIDPGDDVQARGVDAAASLGDVLLAVGREQEFVADVEPPVRPVVWRSDDGTSWEQMDTEGLTAGASEVTVNGLTSDGEAFVAYGEVDDGDQSVLSLWRSVDGESWDEVAAPGLDQEDDVESSERLLGLAILDDTWVGIRESTGFDDSTLRIVRSRGGDPWEEVDAEGLDALDLPNDDIFPPLIAVGGELVLFASVPVEPGEEFGDRQPALLRSEDATTWTTTELDGPTLEEPATSMSIVATSDGAIGYSAGDDELTIWRFAT